LPEEAALFMEAEDERMERRTGPDTAAEEFK